MKKEEKKDKAKKQQKKGNKKNYKYTAISPYTFTEYAAFELHRDSINAKTSSSIIGIVKEFIKARISELEKEGVYAPKDFVAESKGSDQLPAKKRKVAFISIA
eukprot:TRINITY_DN5517_c0_g3_i2.p1 TRINITY_DN5517_c0_g3~~TRINITY_DN5517_c0_g3_i2.p1  ORF type:complete len:103 (+),score=37.28 TRINITY_DN5517_c0_g3_i2:132-440(+)